MNLDRKTKTWLEIATNDLEFAKDILRHGQRPFYAAHFCHQAIEKILKAAIQKNTDKMPPRTHNLSLLHEQSGIKLSSIQLEELLSLSPHYLGTRYPEDINKLYKNYSIEKVKDIFERTERIFSCIKKQITSEKK